MEIIENINVEEKLVEKLKKIKNSIWKKISEKRNINRFEGTILSLLSEIWDLKNQIDLEILIVKFKF